MAFGGPLLPWDMDNPQEQDVIMYKQGNIHRVLIEKSPELFEILSIDVLWPYLRVLHVVDAEMQARLNARRHEQVFCLIDHILHGPSWRFHALLRACALTDQDHVIYYLGFDPHVYRLSSGVKSDEFSPDVPFELQSLDSDFVEAYKTACEKGVETVYQSRVMIVGHFGAGKTSLLRCLLSEPFQEKHISTMGIEADPSKSKVDIDPSDATIGIAKTKDWIPHTEDETFERKLARDTIRRVAEKGERPMEEDVDPQDTLDEKPIPSTPVEECSSMDTDNSDEVTVDLDVSTSSKGIPVQVKKEIGIGLEKGVDTNTKRVELFMWDFAGQGVFYTTHKLFLSSKGIYVVVLDLTKGLKEKILTWRLNESGQEEIDERYPKDVGEYLDYWLSSILTRVTPWLHTEDNAHENYKPPVNGPPVVIVCTHKDQCSEEEVNRYIRDLEEFIRPKDYHQLIYEKIFTISNCTPLKDDLKALKQVFENLAMDQGINVPLLWFKLKEEIQIDGKKTLTWQRIWEMAQTIGIADQRDLEAALAFFHQTGNLVYFNETSLKEFIVTDPQWLIDQFKQIITIQSYHEDSQISKSQKINLELLHQHGILREALIAAIWPDEKMCKLVTSLMKKFGLIKRATETDVQEKFCIVCAADGDFYDVPAMQPLRTRRQDVQQAPDFRTIIDRKGPKLLDTIKMDADLRAELVSRNVILQGQMEDLKAKPGREEIAGLLDYIRAGSKAMYHCFRDILFTTNRQSAYDLLPYDVS